MLISVIGAGYVGLVTAACLAHLDHDVRVVDIDAARVEALGRGAVPIREPGLDELVREGLASGRLSFHSDLAATHGTRLVIVAVGTLDGDGEWTLDLVEKAITGVARDPAAPRRLVVRSTLMPGSAVRLASLASDIDPRTRLCFNPEFTREANAVRDFLDPDRVVIGAGPDTVALVADLRALYARIEKPVVVTDLTSAETIKLASNVFLATKISFANELARLCAATGADVHAVVDGMGLDVRIGRSFLSPGPGFGGSCFPSQVRALPALAARHGVDTPVIAAVAPSNAGQADWILDRMEQVSGRPIAGSRVALLGLTFKAGTDDMRESPALRLAQRLVARGAQVTAFDPIATRAGTQLLAASGVVVEGTGSAAAACGGADMVVVGTEWPEFGQLDWQAIAGSMPGRLVADARRIVDVDAARAAGFTVVAMGVAHPPASDAAHGSRSGSSLLAVPVKAAAAV